jgi:glycosyltransferase involved in cell wall biosynthesis
VSIPHEILIGDDASPDPNLKEKLKSLERLEGVRVHRNQRNLGRAGNRNSLADLAMFPNLLYIDGDAGIVEKDYIKKYLECLGQYEVVYGGRIYHRSRPDERKYWLKWTYASKFEVINASERALDPYRTFGSNNFLVRSDLFRRFPFDESIKTYGYEDSLWASVLRSNGLQISHIENPTLHRADISNLEFLRKTMESLHTLRKIETKGVALEVRLVRVAAHFRQTVPRTLFYIPFWLLCKILFTLLILFPTVLWAYQLFKLSYYITLSDRQSVKGSNVKNL